MFLKKNEWQKAIKLTSITCAILGAIVLVVIGIRFLNDWSTASHYWERQEKALYLDRKGCAWLDQEAGCELVNSVIEQFLSFDGTVTVCGVNYDYYPAFKADDGSFELSMMKIVVGDTTLVPRDTRTLYEMMKVWKAGTIKVRKALLDSVPTYGASNAD